MTRDEFLLELEECLRGEVSDYELADSLSYYTTYIKDEVSLGKTEEEVIESLGSPRLVARSIVDARGEAQMRERANDHYYDGSGRDTVYDPEGEETPGTSLMTSAGRIIVYAAVMAIVFAGFFLLARVLLPVIIVGLVIAFVLRIIRRI